MATTYLVLQRRADAPAWGLVGSAEASGPIQARKKVTEDNGEYLMVPVRNATFEAVTVEQPPPKTTSVLVSAATYLDVQPALPIEEEHSIKVPEAPAAA